MRPAPSAAYIKLRCRRHPCPRFALLLLPFIALLTFSRNATAQSSPELWGRTVTSLHLDCDCSLKLQNFPGAVTQQAGEPLDRGKVSASLKNLYATGRFVDLRAEGAADREGVALTLVARAQYFVGVVTAEGDTGSLEARGLVTASRLRMGEALTRERLEAARRRVTELLVSSGHYQSLLAEDIERDPGTLEANVRLTVKAGPAARVSRVEFLPGAAFPAERLMKISGWHPRLHLTAARVERGRDRLHDFYVTHGYLRSSVNIAERRHDAATNTERVVVNAQAGPLIRVRVQGASVSHSQLRNLLPLYRDGITDNAALAASENELLNYFQQKGYFHAAVKSSRLPRPAPQPSVEILFTVKPGKLGDFAGYGVEGNAAISRSELMATMNPPSEGIFLPRAPTFSQEQVDQKTTALVALYQARGYLGARVTPRINDDYQSVRGRRYVTFAIQEGPRTTVSKLDLAGLDAEARNSLWSRFLCKPGEAYSDERARTDRDHILDYLGDHGYVHATGTWRATAAAEPHQMDVVFEIQPGEQDRIQHVVIVGNEHVRLSLVNRQLLFHDGEPISQSAVAESQRKLYGLGIFNQVQITPQEEETSSPDKTMLVGLEEARRWIVGYGGGIEVQRLGSNTPQGTFKASPRGSLSVTRLDVGGRGQTFSLGGRVSYIDTGADAGYLIPRVFNRDDLDLRIKGLIDRSREVLTFTEDLKQGSFSIEKHFSTKALLIGQYTFQRVEALDISSRVSPAVAELYSQPAIVGLTEGSLIADHRDDPLDATRGSYTLVNGGVAWTGFGSQSSFGRFNGKNATYYTLTPHLVLARLTQFGVVSHFGGAYDVNIPKTLTAPAHTISTEEIPLPERFFMGGSQSMRGFSINQAGPRDPQTGYPIGGNALFLNSVELRTAFAQRRLGVVFFEDAGNVYSSLRTMRLLKVTQSPLGSTADFDYTCHAVGVGVRLKTAVGPLSFDVGYNLNPPKFNVINTVNGVTTTDVQRLSNFQFFLSFGQSF